MKKILIFCQAPSDIKYALTIYERNKNNAEISIVTVNVKGMYEFIGKLNLNISELFFIPYPKNLKRINIIIKTKKYLRSFYKNNFYHIKNYIIYYFSNHFDYMTFFMLKKLEKNNKIIFINHYDDEVAKNYKPASFSLKYLGKKIIYYYITGLWFEFYRFDKSYMLKFPFKRFQITEKKNDILDKGIYDKYSVKINKSDSKKILFLEMDYKKSKIFKNYKSITLKLISFLKKNGFKLYLKPHPRLGYSLFLKDKVDYIVNSDIPAEFIDDSSFDMVIGISSSALAYFAEKGNSKVISLINIYDFKKKNSLRIFESTIE
ncbi:MAG: hypothetical protein ACTSRZ_17830 [Promethearchaeota archaeon]